jgi:dihydrofolate reductase
MRKLVLTENITLDGSIEMLGDWFDPTADGDPEQHAIEERQRAGADAVLLGRSTYEAFAGFWPKQTDDTTGVTDYLNRTRKYVLSTTLVDPEWENTTVLRGPLAEEVTALKEQPGADIVVTGSMSVATAVVAAGLVDEFRLFVYPYVQGGGQRLFTDGAELGKLALVDARGFTNGVVLTTYRATAPAARG